MAAAITSETTVTATTSAGDVVATADSSNAEGGTTWEIYNESTTIPALIGGTGITSALGIPLAPETSKFYFLKSGQVLQCITASGTAVLRRMKIQN